MPNLKPSFAGFASFAICAGLLMISCEPEPATLEPAFLEVVRPFQMGQSPQGISKRKTFTFKNGGGERLTISDFDISPNNGVFYLNMPSLPLVIGGDNAIDLEVTFRPNGETEFSAELTIDYNHGDTPPDPIPLQGTGTTNLVCLPCTPPPESECALGGEVFIYYEVTDATDCENEEGVCSYLIFEESCQDSPCDAQMGHCRENTPADSGAPPSRADSGNHIELNDSGRWADHGDSGHNPVRRDAGSFTFLADSGSHFMARDAGDHTLADSGIDASCTDISCPENTQCQAGVCECLDGYTRFDAGAQCAENCVVAGCDDNNLCTADQCNASGTCTDRRLRTPQL